MWKIRSVFLGRDYRFISSDDRAERFSKIIGARYRLPTVGLYFAPRDYSADFANVKSRWLAQTFFIFIDRDGATNGWYRLNAALLWARLNILAPRVALGATP